MHNLNLSGNTNIVITFYISYYRFYDYYNKARGYALTKKLLEIIRLNSKVLEPVPTGENKYSNCSEKIESIIFDIYGTLFISASGDIGTIEGNKKSDIFITALKQSGIDILSNEAGIKGLDIFYKEIHNSHFNSIKNNIENPEVIITEIWEKTLAKLLNKKLIKTKLSNNTIFQTATYFECLTNPVWPMPDLLKVLNTLNKYFVLGIISNAQFYTPLIFKALTNNTLKDLGFKPELIQYSYICREAKPSLKMFNSIISKLKSGYNINPSNTLYVGNDMLNDIYSANSAGFKTALFAGDARSLRIREKDPRVFGVKPDFLITELMQITDLIN